MSKLVARAIIAALNLRQFGAQTLASKALTICGPALALVMANQ
jgi:hypothetical protein